MLKHLSLSCGTTHNMLSAASMLRFYHAYCFETIFQFSSPVSAAVTVPFSKSHASKKYQKIKNGFNSFQAKYQTDTIQIASSYRHAFRTKAATMLQCCKCHACCVCVINCVCDREGWPITCGSIPKNTCGSKYLSKQITCGSKNHLWGWGGAREEKG